MNLKSKVAVVTGSSRGIGRAIALELAKQGAHVIVWGSGEHSETNIAGVMDELAQLDVERHSVLADLNDLDATTRVIQQCWEWKNGVDIWVNNAGVDVLTGENATLDFFTKLDRLWHVDVVGAMHCSRLIGKRMQAVGHGTIINIGWDQAWQGMEGDSGEMFSAIKGAVMAFTKSLAKSLAPDVRVNCVAPGWIKTAWGEEDASEYWHRRATGESLRDRWGTPDDIAKAVCFLASSDADFINGQVIPVNGGFRPTIARDQGSS